MFRRDDRFLDGGHAANRGTIGVAADRIPAPYALKEGNSFHRTSVRKSLQAASGRPRRRQHAFELHAGQNICETAVAQLFPKRGLEFLDAGRKNNAADFDVRLHRLLIMHNRACRACLDAFHAFAAQAAGQTALRFEHCLFKTESQVDFRQIPQTCCDLRLRHPDTIPQRCVRLWDWGQDARDSFSQQRHSWKRRCFGYWQRRG